MSPREGHFEALYVISHFLCKNPKKSQVMDPSTIMINEIVSRCNADWVEFYMGHGGGRSATNARAYR